MTVLYQLGMAGKYGEWMDTDGQESREWAGEYGNVREANVNLQQAVNSCAAASPKTHDFSWVCGCVYPGSGDACL